MWYYVRQIFKKLIFCSYWLYFVCIHKDCLIPVWHPDVIEIKKITLLVKESIVLNFNGILCECRFIKDTFIYVLYDLTTALWLDNIIWWFITTILQPRGNIINRQRMFVWVWMFVLWLCCSFKGQHPGVSSFTSELSGSLFEQC